MTGKPVKFRYTFELPKTLASLRIEGQPGHWALVEFCAPVDVERLREWIKQNVSGDYLINSILNEVVYFQCYDDALLCYMSFK